MNRRRPRPVVYLVDDDEPVRDSLSMLLRAAGYAVETFESAQQFIDKRGHASTGCLVLDMRMPGMSGLELQDWLAKSNGMLPIVFLTGHGDVPTAVRAMKRGAFEFLQKPVDDTRLIAAVEAALAGERGVPEPPRALPDAVASLSRREREVLALILNGRRTRDIADALFISVKTVEFHRTRIHAKLGVASMAELFTLCLGAPARQAAPIPG